MKYGVNLQKKIFINGLAGKTPTVPINHKTLQAEAQKVLSPKAFAYIAGGAGTNSTERANRDALFNYKLKANMLQASQEIDMGVELFGRKYHTPILTAPIGVLELAHKEADIAVAKACSKVEVPMVFSNQASFSMERCAAEMGNSPRWFQLYYSKSEELVASLLQRAEKAACDALVVTLDTTSLGWRPDDLDLGYLPFIHAKGIAQYSSDPVFQAIVTHGGEDETMQSADKPPINLKTITSLLKICKKYPGSFFKNLIQGRAMDAVRTFINIYMRPTLSWDDILRLRDLTSLPIVLKGIQTVKDAMKAAEMGMDGIVVSNHGGRQIDGGVAAIECLDKICSTAILDIPVLFDSGIRTGADVIKALALGADAVFVGRPFVYGLAIAGEDGVKQVLENLLGELELQLSLMGINSIHQLDRKHIYT